MRRMITNKQVVDVVNKAIEEGEIQAGGLPQIQEGDAGKVLTVNAGETAAEWAEVNALPEIQEGDAGKLLAVNSGETGVEWVDDNNLKLPESAPAAQQLIGVNTSGEQNALGIGHGLEITNGKLVNDDFYEITILGSSSSSSISATINDIPSDILADIKAFKIKNILLHFGHATSLQNCTQSAILAVRNGYTSSGTAAYFEGNSVILGGATSGSNWPLDSISYYHKFTASLSTSDVLTISGTKTSVVTLSTTVVNKSLYANDGTIISSGTFNATQLAALKRDVGEILIITQDMTVPGTSGSYGVYNYFRKCGADETYIYYRNDCTVLQNNAGISSDRYEYKITKATGAYTVTQI